MSATIEWLCVCCGVVRWHKAERSKIGDPYYKAATIYRHDEQTAEIMGLVGVYTRKQREQLAARLREEGITTVLAHRIRRDGTSLLKIIRVPKEKKDE